AIAAARKQESGSVGEGIPVNEQQIMTVMDQGGVSRERAIELLKKHDRDVVSAVLDCDDIE
ncbi:hypothetical protein KIPB_014555, partial [Kipferlia bialata]